MHSIPGRGAWPDPSCLNAEYPLCWNCDAKMLYMKKGGEGIRTKGNDITLFVVEFDFLVS
jgi:hypothetical protein